MTKHEYRPMSEAQKDGTPIIAVCGGVECCAVWEEHTGRIAYLSGWYHWDDDEMGGSERIRDEPSGWRRMF